MSFDKLVELGILEPQSEERVLERCRAEEDAKREFDKLTPQFRSSRKRAMAQTSGNISITSLALTTDSTPRLV